jgi:hypothetical protein
MSTTMTNDDDMIRVHNVKAFQIGPVRNGPDDEFIMFRPFFYSDEVQYFSDSEGIMGLTQEAALDIAKRLLASVDALQTGEPFKYAAETIQ